MRSLAVIAMLVSSSVFACPNLAGKYTVCRSQTGTSESFADLVISQKLQNRITQYEVNYTDESGEKQTEKYLADGKTYVQTTEDSDMKFESAVTSSCTATSLKIKAVLKVDGQIMNTLEETISKTGNQLSISSNMMIDGETVAENVVCE